MLYTRRPHIDDAYGERQGVLTPPVASWADAYPSYGRTGKKAQVGERRGGRGGFAFAHWNSTLHLPEAGYNYTKAYYCYTPMRDQPMRGGRDPGDKYLGRRMSHYWQHHTLPVAALCGGCQRWALLGKRAASSKG